MIGGVSLQVHYLANTLVRRGHQVTVFSLYPKTADALYEVRQIVLHRLLQRIVDAIQGFAIHFFPWYVCRENFDSYDIIHAHGDSHFIRTRKPMVRTFHSSGLDQAMHATSLRYFFGMLSIYPFEIYSGLIARERVYVSDEAPKYYPFRSRRVIRNGVDLSLFGPGKEKSRCPSILFVAGTMTGRKRGRYLIQEFQKHVWPVLPRAELWMVCKEKVVQAGIKCFGLLMGRDLVDLYQKAWIFCIPSAHETFGVPYIEAMACGTPVVTTPNDGSLEVLGGGEYGCIVSKRELGPALLRLLNDEKERRILSTKGLARAQDFSLEKMCDEYESLYHGLSDRGIRV